MSNGIVTGTPRARQGSSVASATAILMAGFVLSRLLGLMRVSIQGSVLAAHGANATAFTTAIAIPDLLFTLVSGGALGSSFIPVFGGMLALGDEERAWKVASGVMNGVLLVMLSAVVLAELAAPALVSIVVPPADQALTLTLTRIMLLQPLFLAVSGIMMGVYNSYHRFVAPAIAPLVYNLANIVGLLLVPVFHDTVALAAWGVVIGALLQIAVMAPGLAAYQRLIQPGVGLGEPGTREVGRLMVPRIVGQAGIQFSVLVTFTLANRFFSDAPSAAIRLSANLLALPVGIFGGAVATAAFPTMTAQAARGDLAALGETVSRTLRVMLFFSMPAAVGLVILRYPITTVLFRHGIFGAHDTDLVTSALLLYAAGVPVWVAVELLPRAFFALKDTWTPVLINLVTLATAIIISVIGAWLARGNSIVGVTILTGAISFSVLLEVLWLGLVLRRRVTNLGLRNLAVTALRCAVASEAMAVALLALLYLWRPTEPESAGGDALLLLVAIPFGVAVYVGWSYIVRTPELATAWTMVRARLGRWLP